MTMVQKMRSQLRESMKARDAVRTGFLRYWIAQLTLGTGAEMPDSDAIKKMRGVLKEARSGLTTFHAGGARSDQGMGTAHAYLRTDHGGTCTRLPSRSRPPPRKAWPWEQP